MALKLRIALLGLGVVAACHKADKSVCLPLYDPSSWKPVRADVKKDAIAANNCVRKKAYELGKAEGSETEIGIAAVQACSDAIELYVLEFADAGLIESADVNTTLESERDRLAKLASSYVIQTRVGACDKMSDKDLNPSAKGVWRG